MANWSIVVSKKPEVVKLDNVVNWLIAASNKPKVVKLDIVVNWLIAGSKKPEVVKLDILWLTDWLQPARSHEVVKLDILWLTDWLQPARSLRWKSWTVSFDGSCSTRRSFFSPTPPGSSEQLYSVFFLWPAILFFLFSLEPGREKIIFL